ncbi:RnfABCDGE type electron transport complex subunit B [candidate division WOR-3 bacterium]|nr:RnfABCDGE type electron transport complex subunit B [candidate division WOR-3 bacterium]
MVWLSIMTLGGLGLVFGLFLTYAGKKFHVEVDPRVTEIRNVLPGANCGGCGAPGCDQFAEGVVAGKYPVNGCVVGGQETADKIAKIMGVEATMVEPKVAVVRCLGDFETAKRFAEYNGISTCKAMDLIGGNKGCVYGCLGLGDCVESCPFNAMYMGENGLPVVIEENCTGCGECVRACPKGIMELIPKNQKVYLACVSPERGTDVSSVCSKGCIGCTLCSRVVPEGQITMNGYIPILHYDKVENPDDLMPAVEKCPTKTFVVRKI